MYSSFTCPMKIPHPRKLILTAALPLLTPSCDSNRGQSRETQLEKTALELETKAEEILDQTQETPAAKENQATKILQENGSEEIAATSRTSITNRNLYHGRSSVKTDGNGETGTGRYVWGRYITYGELIWIQIEIKKVRKSCLACGLVIKNKLNHFLG